MLHKTAPVILHTVYHLKLSPPIVKFMLQLFSCSGTLCSALAKKTFSLAINYDDNGKMHKARLTPFLFPLINILKQLHYNNVF